MNAKQQKTLAEAINYNNEHKNYKFGSLFQINYLVNGVIFDFDRFNERHDDEHIGFMVKRWIDNIVKDTYIQVDEITLTYTMAYGC